MAASVPPLRSLAPSAGGASTSARRRRGRAVALVTLGVCALAIGGLRYGARSSQPHPLITQVASGSPSVRTTPSGAEERWLPGSPPAFVLDPSLDQISPDAKGAIVDAFTAWDSANLGLPKASFTISSSHGAVAQDGVSRILFAPITVSGFEDALAVTIAYADADSGQVQEADLVINSKYTFTVVASGASTTSDRGCSGDYDVQDVITHEAGHVYGLGEDYADSTSTMFYSSQKCETHKRALSPSDLQAMTALYAPVKDMPATASGVGGASASCSAGHLPGRSSGHGGFGGWGVGALVALSLTRRARAGEHRRGESWRNHQQRTRGPGMRGSVR